jgi:hypothetical protein
VTSGTTIGKSRAESQGVVDIASAVSIERSLTLTTKELALEELATSSNRPKRVTRNYE